MTIHVYQDRDPLGKGEWFSYNAANGHVIQNFGGYVTEEQAYLAAGGKPEPPPQQQERERQQREGER